MLSRENQNPILAIISQKKEIPQTIWLMRQAGRYLPEYMEIRKNIGNFLDLCYNPELAAEVTLQPMRRFDLDAAIVFSDILVVPNYLGLKLEFTINHGPELEEVKDIKQLDLANIENIPTYQTIKNTKKRLKENKALIGFAGAPWTVCTYIFSDGSKDYQRIKKLAYEDSSLLNQTMEILTVATINYLSMQIKAGADIVKIFDSWAGILPEDLYIKYVINPTKKIMDELKKIHPNTPIIAFPRNSGYLYEKYLKEVNPDVIAVDQNLPFEIIKKLAEKVIIQGNLDPVILLTNKEIIKKNVDKIKKSFANQEFIFNLGHGILPNTPIENVEYLVNYVKNSSNPF